MLTLAFGSGPVFCDSVFCDFATTDKVGTELSSVSVRMKWLIHKGHFIRTVGWKLPFCILVFWDSGCCSHLRGSKKGMLPARARPAFSHDIQHEGNRAACCVPSLQAPGRIRRSGAVVTMRICLTSIGSTRCAGEHAATLSHADLIFDGVRVTEA